MLFVLHVFRPNGRSCGGFNAVVRRSTSERKYTERTWDKASLDIFWLKDDSLEDSVNLREPGVLAAAIVEDLQAALEQFRMIADALNK